jgi:single-strand DNA-binding protein
LVSSQAARAPPAGAAARKRRVGAAQLRRIAMYNEAQFSVAGYVAREPDYAVVGNGIPRLKVRVAWTTRRKDPATGEWADANTSWISVTCWRQLALNLHTCLRKGDPVVLRGRLEVRPFIDKDEQPRTSVDVDADFLGHDLRRGVAGFQKTLGASAKAAQGENGAGAVPADEAALTADPDRAGEEDDLFDDSAIEALAKEADGVAAPF